MHSDQAGLDISSILLPPVPVIQSHIREGSINQMIRSSSGNKASKDQDICKKIHEFPQESAP